MRGADQATIDSGVSSFELMQSAGRAVGRAAVAMMGGAYGRRITVVCGKGNNAGDGMVAATYLHRRGALVSAILIDDPSRLTGDAATAFRQLPPGLVSTFDAVALDHETARSLLVVDALFGTGFRGALEGTAAEAAQIVNDSAAAVLSIDIPSGVNGETGAISGIAIRATKTITLAAMKTGLLLNPGAAFAGDVEVADIGITTHDIEGAASMPTAADVAQVLPPRLSTSHKRSVGKVLVVAGSRGMSGAAVLAATAALRTGAGLVWAAVPRSIAAQVDQSAAEVVVADLPQTPDGSIEPSAAPQVMELAAQADAIVLGPGLGGEIETKQFVHKVVRELGKPKILDADAINAFAGHSELLAAAGPAVITPHAGELAALLGTSSAEIDESRIECTRQAAGLTGTTVLLKGAPTLVADPWSKLVFVNAGTSILATAGTGDVLAGVIAALAAGGAPLFKASWAGAWLHGMAGRVVGELQGDRGMLASDLLKALPEVIREVESLG